MKPPAFDYVVASSVSEACALLEADPDAKVIAGGQSLIPLLSLRFANPSRLIDISRVPGLRSVQRTGDRVVIGALTRHADIQTDPVVRGAAPLLAAAADWVAHPQIRNRGTFGGAIAHSDSAAEFPAALLALGATVLTAGRGGERRIAARDFFGPHFETALELAELVVGVEVPATDPMSRWGFFEFARRKGDYAIGGAAVSGKVDDAGRCIAVNAGLISAGPGPTAAEGLQDVLLGRVVDAEAVDLAAASVARTLRPESNVHGAQEYRRAVVAETLRRALRQAFEPGLSDSRDAKKSA